MSDRLLFRLYDPASVGPDGYPVEWHRLDTPPCYVGPPVGVKHLVRAEAGHRCERCGHPFVCGETPAEWSPCDERCTHGGPVRYRFGAEPWVDYGTAAVGADWDRLRYHGAEVEARWRVLTVHHLNGVKWDLRWWNLAALCQRCHLTIQGKVVMERVYPFEHSDWMKPHAAGYYAASYLGEDLTREQTMARLDELLALERMA